MNVGDLPVVGGLVRSGADDRVFDGLLFVGPFVVLAIAAFGRTAVTTGLAAGYLAVFVCYTLYKAVSRDGSDAG